MTTKPKLTRRGNPEDDCPNRADHTPHPKGYLAHGEWAEKMLADGYRQRKCPGCGLYAIWELRAKKRAPSS